MNKKILAILMTVCMVVTMIPVVAFAAQTGYSNVKWGDKCFDGDRNSAYDGTTIYETHSCNEIPEAVVNVAARGTTFIYFHDIDNAVSYVNEKSGVLYPIKQNATFHNDLVFDSGKDIHLNFYYLDKSKPFNINKDIKIENGTEFSLAGGTYMMNANGGNTISVSGSFILAGDAELIAGSNDAIVAERSLKDIMELSRVCIIGKLKSDGKGIIAKMNAEVFIQHPGNAPNIGDYATVECKDDAVTLEKNANLEISYGCVKSSTGTAIIQKGLNAKSEIKGGLIEGNNNAIKVLAGRLAIESPEGYPLNIESKAGDAIVLHAGASHPSIRGVNNYPVVKAGEGFDAVKSYASFLEGFIYEGTYSSDVSNYVVKGHNVKKESDNWIVGEASNDSNIYEVKVIGNNFIYLGFDIKPLLYVTKDGHYVNPLSYTKTYNNNDKPGEAEVIISISNKEVARATFNIQENNFKSLSTLNKASTLLLSKDASGLKQSDSTASLPQNTLGDTNDETSFIDTIATKIKEVAENVEYLLTSPDLQRELKAALEDARKVWAELIAIIGNSTN